MRPTLLVLWLAACGGEASFPRDVAEVGCAQAQACDEPGFVDAFGTLDECVRRERHLMEDAAASAEALGCEFDHDEATDCLDGIPGADCATYDLEQALTDCASAFGCVP